MNAVASRNVKFISHSDQGGRGDGVQIMVHRGYAYIGHGYSNGISVIDVRDPKNPRPVAFMPCPPNTRAIHLQTHDDLLLAVNGPSMWTMQVDAQAYYSGSPADLLKGRQYTAGVRVYDIAHPDAPREIAFMATEGVGPHRIWYVGGRYAYVSIHYPEFTDQVLAIVDMAEPTRPEVVGKWWMPGMWTGGGETPSWPKGRRYALHHALVVGNLAFGAWRDGGLTVLEVGDPTRPKLLAHRNLDPPFGGGTHSPLPLPDRNLLVLADEANFANCSRSSNMAARSAAMDSAVAEEVCSGCGEATRERGRLFVVRFGTAAASFPLSGVRDFEAERGPRLRVGAATASFATSADFDEARERLRVGFASEP
jgi:hypothetical protein